MQTIRLLSLAIKLTGSELFNRKNVESYYDLFQLSSLK